MYEEKPEPALKSERHTGVFRSKWTVFIRCFKILLNKKKSPIKRRFFVWVGLFRSFTDPFVAVIVCQAIVGFQIQIIDNEAVAILYNI